MRYLSTVEKDPRLDLVKFLTTKTNRHNGCSNTLMHVTALNLRSLRASVIERTT